ncbi:5'(3')-deoxyribonucleotidase, mitochondrial-like [Lingula anatina]|uniref:5'(3')-deoxyribonucleotidase, mitochondrial-like n=1 Tax=Lingula anatina TaxID=7574 RepID=A0A1S3J3V8_LINAN|nr:5'(3')-deoxyribonucleotidase, mitochondrial-like [Lingula anatina]XP_023931527.1 5'(3')-deoxyribonucleotidase, mitochondrial-like [Lingula anatina]|eukprot:XP_013404549.1 5'(3')-deoxyribonucleotidase, mitochondrial-like [Lingula anatina]
MSRSNKKTKRLWETRNLRVLVDMDCVLADFEGSLLKKWKERYPNEPHIALEERRGFYVTKQYGDIREDLKSKIIEVLSSEGFFRELPPIEGAIDAIKEISSMEGVEVFICTAPLKEYQHCAVEKYEWIEKYFGRDWLARVILTRDKTVISADLLIDDRTDITGAEKNPSWRQVVFTACHNKHTPSNLLPKHSVRLESWLDSDTWKQIIEDAKKKL